MPNIKLQKRDKVVKIKELCSLYNLKPLYARLLFYYIVVHRSFQPEKLLIRAIFIQKSAQKRINPLTSSKKMI